jgi:hypothetical protein
MIEDGADIGKAPHRVAHIYPLDVHAPI